MNQEYDEMGIKEIEFQLLKEIKNPEHHLFMWGKILFLKSVKLSRYISQDKMYNRKCIGFLKIEHFLRTYIGFFSYCIIAYMRIVLKSWIQR